MKISRFAALAGAASLAVGLSACGGGGGASGGDSIKIGIKFDQPGLGLNDAGKYSGFDVDVANYVAKELGKTKVTFVQAPSKQREDLIATGQVDLIFATYSITDARKEKVSFAGPYFIAGQDLLVAADSTITGPKDLDGKKLCSVTGSTSADNVKKDYPGRSAAELRHLLQVFGLGRQRPARRPHHRQHYPCRVCRAAGLQGQAQGRRCSLLGGALRRRPEEG
jgi:glutamate transport system substrate-binding protein